MKYLITLAIALVSYTAISFEQSLDAADAIIAGSTVNTPLKAGDPIGAFRVIKVAGAVEDGLEPGDELCYRCRYGSSPMVLVFARKNSAALVNLAKQIDRAVTKHSGQKMHGLLTFFGDESPNLKDMAEAFAKESGESLIPIVIAKEATTGPIEYRLSSEDQVTVVIAMDSQVFANLSSSADEIDFDAITEAVQSMLSEEGEGE